jgi:hypothetical protein
MRTLAAALIVTALGAVAANAQPGRLSDTAYLEAARCVGLASSKTMNVADAKAMDAWLKEQSAGRIGYVLDKADQMKMDARRQADGAKDPLVKAKLDQELQGACAQLRA